MSTTLSADCKDPRVADSIRWLLQELGKIPYGEIALTFTVHDGTVRTIDRSTREKQKTN
jgi:hypothetical protein